MPFKSKAQQRFMFAKHPDVAKKWAEHTRSIKDLPEKLACVAPGISIEKRSDFALNTSETYMPLLATQFAGMGLGTLGGYGLAKLTSPATTSVKNLQREELISQYNRAIDDIKARLILKKERALKS